MENRETLRPFDVLDCIRGWQKGGSKRRVEVGIKVFYRIMLKNIFFRLCHKNG